LSYYVTEQKPGGGATSHAKMAGRRQEPKFDDYTQNSINIKKTVELHRKKFLVRSNKV
jgi:hypothetical protein